MRFPLWLSLLDSTWEGLEPRLLGSTQPGIAHRFATTLTGFSMTQPQPPVRKPSLFVAGLVGHFLAVAIGATIYFMRAIKTKDYQIVVAFQFLLCVGALGAYLGYLFARKRSQDLGVGDPTDTGLAFLRSTAFNLLALIMLAGTFGISVLGAFLFDAFVQPN